MTIPYYDANSRAFFDRSVDLDLSHLHETFEHHLRTKPAHILDAGCGSGRDSKAFLERGHQVTAFDASAPMVQLARQYTGLDVQHMTFHQMAFAQEFDGVWANASLVHLPKSGLVDVFAHIVKILKPDGVFYASFKIGIRHGPIEDGRHYTDFDADSIRAFVAQFSELSIEETMITPDGRPGYADWMNVFMRRS